MFLGFLRGSVSSDAVPSTLTSHSINSSNAAGAASGAGDANNAHLLQTPAAHGSASAAALTSPYKVRASENVFILARFLTISCFFPAVRRQHANALPLGVDAQR